MGNATEIADLIPLPAWAVLGIARNVSPQVGDVVLFSDREKHRRLGRFDGQSGNQVRVTVFTPGKPTGEVMMVNAAALCGVLDSVKVLRADPKEAPH